MDTKQTKEVALSVSRAIMKGDWGAVDKLLSDDFRYVGDKTNKFNKAEYIDFMKNKLARAMVDMDMDFTQVVAEGDMVAVDYVNKMTHVKPFFGVPNWLSKKRLESTGQFMRQVENGKVVAEWQTTNTFGMMIDMGAFKLLGIFVLVLLVLAGFAGYWFGS